MSYKLIFGYVLKFACIVAIQTGAAANASILRIVWEDPFGDSNTVQFDSTGAEILIDNSTGSFELTIFAHPFTPFNGNLNVSWGVRNGNLGCCRNVLDGNFNRRNLEPTTELKEFGVYPALMYWQAGHSIFKVNGRVTFVDALDYSGADGIFREDGTPHFIQAVPIPPSVMMFTAAILGLPLVSGLSKSRLTKR